jgi:hypothetical protein
VRIRELSRSYSFAREDLRRKVYEANQSKSSRLPFDLGTTADWLSVDILVDLNLLQVYGFHFHIKYV